MKHLILALPLLALALLGFGCDRFPHDFGPPQTVDFAAELFTPLQAAFAAQGTAGLEPVMDFYTDDYLHFGQYKSDRRNWLEGIFAGAPGATTQVTLLNSQLSSDSTAIANWRLVVDDPDGRVVLADSIFTGERLVRRGGKWLLRGNQMTCLPPVPPQRVIIEYFTFVGCPNCPIVEDKLHQLKDMYPDQLSYLEHHTTGPLAVSGDGTYNYYGPFTIPTSIFQGETRLTGSGQDILDAYVPLAQNLAAQNASFRYSNLSYGIEGQLVSGSITLERLAEQVGFANLVLNVVLIERVSSFTNVQGVPLKNVVRAKTTIDISGADLSQPVPFVVNSGVVIPDDASLVIFAQTKPSPFANNARIHSGIEVPLQVPAKGGKALATTAGKAN